MLMRSIRRWVIGLGLLWALTMLFAGIAQGIQYRAQARIEDQLAPAPTGFDLPEQYLPANPVPTTCVEDWYAAYYDYSSDTRFCSMSWNDRTLYLAFSRSQRQIIRTSYLSRTVTLGELVLAWGQPLRMAQHTLYNEVYWADRYLWVFDKRFSPFSRRLYIIYTHDMPPSKNATSWAGFKN